MCPSARRRQSRTVRLACPEFGGGSRKAGSRALAGSRHRLRKLASMVITRRRSRRSLQLCGLHATGVECRRLRRFSSPVFRAFRESVRPLRKRSCNASPAHFSRVARTGETRCPTLVAAALVSTSGCILFSCDRTSVCTSTPWRRRNSRAILTPHPGPLPVEGRGRRDQSARTCERLRPRSHERDGREFCTALQQQLRGRDTLAIRVAAPRPPSPLNGERAGVRGENGQRASSEARRWNLQGGTVARR